MLACEVRALPCWTHYPGSHVSSLAIAMFLGHQTALEAVADIVLTQHTLNAAPSNKLGTTLRNGSK